MGNFIDADIADLHGVGIPNLIVSTKDSQYPIQIYDIDELDGTVKLSLDMESYEFNHSGFGEQISNEYSYYLYNEGDKCYLMYYSVSVVEMNLNETTTFWSVGIPISFNGDDGLEIGTNYIENKVDGNIVYAYGNTHFGDEISSDEALAIMEKYTKAASTWGISTGKIVDLDFQNTNGERLKQYFTE